MKASIMLCSCLLLAPTLAASAQDVETTQAYVSNGQLEYVGDLDEAANRKLFALYETLSPKPTVLSIRSPGGEVNAGMTLGTWVHDHGIDVRVMEFCLSSCANYVFPAGIKKIVSNFAVIGYHGGPADPAKMQLDAYSQAMYDGLSPEKRKAFMDDIAAMSMRDGRRESAYFRQIGVRGDISSLGQQSRYEQFARAHPDSAGWTYTLEGFASLGVRDILVINPPWKPGGNVAHVAFVTIPVDKPAKRQR